MKRLLLFLLLFNTSWTSGAEPLDPLLTKASVDSLRAALWRSPPGISRLNVLLRLSNALVTRHEGLWLSLDSAYAYGRQASLLSDSLHLPGAKIQSAYLLGRILPFLHKVAQGNELLQQGIAISVNQQDKHSEAAGWFYLGASYHGNGGDLPGAIACFEKARSLYLATDDRASAAYLLKRIADVHLAQAKYPQVHDELLQVLAEYRRIDYRRLHYTYDLLVATDEQLANYQEAIQFGQAAIERAKETHDTAYLSYFYLRLADVYETLHQYGISLSYRYQALAQMKREEKPSPSEAYLSASGAIATTLIKLHQPTQAIRFLLQQRTAYPPTNDEARYRLVENLADGYLASKQYDEAEKFALQGVVLATNVARRHESFTIFYRQIQYNACVLLSKVYLATHQYARARLALNQGFSIGSQTASLTDNMTFYLLLFKVDSAQGKLLDGIAHYQHYKALNDSIFNSRSSAVIASLRTQADTEKREHNLDLLTKQNFVQRVSLRQREFQRNALFGGALLMLLLLGLGYNRYRLKQRSNQQLQAQQLEISRKNTSLEALLAEKDQLLEDKEWMMKEIHHRVKNNLQIISSLLHSQAIYLKDKAALSAIQLSQNRVHAMALIHQKLYQGSQLASVPMQAYVQEIVTYLIASFDSQRLVRAELAVADVLLDVSLAVPVGLILNEAITNSLKYAFPHPQPGIIHVSLTYTEKTYCLIISDNGKGLPDGFDLKRGGTLGLSLIRGLSKQLDGRLQIDGLDGVRINLEFDDVEPMAHGEIIPGDQQAQPVVEV